MEYINNVLYISSTPDSISEIYTSQLERNLPVHFIRVESIHELFTAIYTNCTIDFISIDTEMLLDNEQSPVEIISSLQTLVNCSLCAKTCKKKIKIVLCIHPNTDSNLVKNLTAIEGIRLLKKVESWQSYSQFEEDVKNYLSDNYTHPLSVRSFIAKQQKPESNTQLTCRQQQIATLIVDKGMSNKEIARILSISISTVKLHVGILLKKYKVTRRTQLASKFNSALK